MNLFQCVTHFSHHSIILLLLISQCLLQVYDYWSWTIPFLNNELLHLPPGVTATQRSVTCTVHLIDPVVIVLQHFTNIWLVFWQFWFSLSSDAWMNLLRTSTCRRRRHLSRRVAWYRHPQISSPFPSNQSSLIWRFTTSSSPALKTKSKTNEENNQPAKASLEWSRDGSGAVSNGCHWELCLPPNCFHPILRCGHYLSYRNKFTRRLGLIYFKYLRLFICCNWVALFILNGVKFIGFVLLTYFCTRGLVTVGIQFLTRQEINLQTQCCTCIFPNELRRF